MKKLIIITIVLFTNSKIFCQSIVNLNSVINVTLPIGAVSVSHNQAQSFVSQIFNNDPGAAIHLANVYSNVYRVDNIVFKFHLSNKQVQSGHLQEVKNMDDKVLTPSKGYASQIMNINGKDILIRKYTGSVSYDTFICYNNSNSAAITGMLIYNKADDAQAQLVLNAILASIKFAGE